MTIAMTGRAPWREVDPHVDRELADAPERVGASAASAILLVAGLTAALVTALAAVVSL